MVQGLRPRLSVTSLVALPISIARWSEFAIGRHIAAFHGVSQDEMIPRVAQVERTVPVVLAQKPHQGALGGIQFYVRDRRHL